MPIRKIKNKGGSESWEINASYRGRRLFRKLPCKQFTKKQAQQAETALRERLFQEVELGIKPKTIVTFNDFKGEFLKFSKANKKPRTFQSHENSINHLTPHFGKTPLDEISLNQVKDYVLSRSDKVKTSTINRELSCLKYMLNLAEQWDKVDRTITRKIKIDRRGEGPGRIKYLTPKQIESLIEAANPMHLKVFYVISFSTGLRKGEVLGLTWNRVDLTNGLLYVEKTATHDSPKSGKYRQVHISPEVCEVLEAWKPHTDGKTVFEVKDIKRSHRTACKNAGIDEDFQPRDTRHAYATLQRWLGTGLDTLKESLGHSTITMTMRYAHVGDRRKIEGAQKIGKAIKSALKGATKSVK